MLVLEFQPIAAAVEAVHRAGDEYRLRIAQTAVGVGLHLQKAVHILALVEAALRPAVGGDLLVEDFFIFADDILGVRILDALHPHGGHADIVAVAHIDVLRVALLVIDKASGDDLGIVHAGGAGIHYDIAHRGGGPDDALVALRGDCQPLVVAAVPGERRPVVLLIVNEDMGLQIVVAVGHIVHAGGDDQLVKAVLIHILRHQVHHGLVFHRGDLVDLVVAQQLEHI